MTPRVEKLRNDLVDTVPSICSERAKIFTESMKKTEGLPIEKRKAKAFFDVLNHMSIYVRDNELIVGNQGSKPRSAPVYPEFAVDWIVREFKGDPYRYDERPNDVYEYDAETENEIMETVEYWKGKTLDENVRKILPENTKKAWDIGAIDDDWCTMQGFGNLLPNYEDLLRQGLKGIIEHAKKKLSESDLRTPGQVEKCWFLESVILSNQGVINYAHRYADKLAEMARSEQNAARKAELEQMSESCRWVPENPPRTFWEALQSIWFLHLGMQLETNGIAISFGRFDQFMWPYYQNDIQKGILTREKALELVESFFIKVNELCFFRSWLGAKFYPGYHMAVNLAIGGQTKDGKDAVNELTYISVEACENIRMPRPAVSFKWFEGTSREFMDRAMQAIQKHGGGQPAFYNDRGVMKSLENLGIDKKDSWNWAPVGCIEASIPGKFDFACKGPRINIAKVLEITLNNGTDPNTGVTLLPGDGDLSSFKSMDEIKNAFEKQLHYFMEQQVILENINDQMHIRFDLNAFQSSLIDDCIERGKSLIQGGSVYSADGGPAVAAISAADCLTGIQTAVFDQKWFTGAALKHAIETNYEDDSTTPTGEEIRLMLLNRAPKFGNDDDLADKWASEVTGYVGSHYVNDFKNSRYGKGPVPCTYAFCQSSVTANVAMGTNVKATPDGRKAGTPLNNGVSPATGVEKSGITATINSVSKLPSIWFSKGAIFNMRLSPSMLQSPAGRDRTTALVETLFKNDQYHVQFNVVSTETLRDAQQHPERYKDLMVRIAGYSAFFAPLNKDLQEDIIKRTIFEEASC